MNNGNIGISHFFSLGITYITGIRHSKKLLYTYKPLWDWIDDYLPIWVIQLLTMAHMAHMGVSAVFLKKGPQMTPRRHPEQVIQTSPAMGWFEIMGLPGSPFDPWCIIIPTVEWHCWGTQSSWNIFIEYPHQIPKYIPGVSASCHPETTSVKFSHHLMKHPHKISHQSPFDTISHHRLNHVKPC